MGKERMHTALHLVGGEVVKEVVWFLRRNSPTDKHSKEVQATHLAAMSRMFRNSF
jgi:hypothetical protein